MTKNIYVQILSGLLVLCCLATNTSAQVDTQSPYSFYGIGSPQRNQSLSTFAMGGVYNSIRDSSFVNYLNPASYTTIDITQLQFGFENNISNRTISGVQGRDINTYINQLTLSFPVIKRPKFGWGMSFGFMPYSQSGYRFRDSSNQIFGQDTIRTEERYTGRGGLNKVYWGNAFRLWKGLSLGVNANFMFGTITRSKNLYFPGNSTIGTLSTRVEETTRLEEFTVDLGVQYDFKINIPKFKTNALGKRDSTARFYTLGFGATYSPGITLNADFSRLGITFLNTGGDLGTDTFEITPSAAGRIVLPSSFGFGMHFGLPESWLLAADVYYTTWSEFQYFDQPNLPFANTFGASIGAQYSARKAKKMFFRNSIYRIGARYQNRYVQPDGNAIDEYAFSWGLSLPIGFKNVYAAEAETKKVVSYLNFGMEFGFANSRNNGIVNEQFLRFNIGLVLRDKWFNKRKFN